jgi:hypothetical protein
MVGADSEVAAMGNAAVARKRRCEAEWRCEAERPETCLMKHDSSRADESMAALCQHPAPSTQHPALSIQHLAANLPSHPQIHHLG